MKLPTGAVYGRVRSLNLVGMAGAVMGGMALAGCVLASLTVAPPARAAETAQSAKPSYRLGVFPYLPALTIDRRYSLVAEAFSMELDRLVKLRTKTTFENFENAMVGESYDIVFLHPFFLVDAMDHYSYVPIARLAKPLNAILTVREDSPAVTIDDLVGGTIGLPPKLGSISNLIKNALIEARLRPGLDIGIRHFRSKGSCIAAVTLGSVAACGLPAFLMPGLTPGRTSGAPGADGLERPALRVVFKAAPVSNFAFAVHRRVPEAERRRLQELVLSWSGDNHDMIDVMGLPQGFVPALSEDYAEVRNHRTRLQTLAQN